MYGGTGRRSRSSARVGGGLRAAHGAGRALCRAHEAPAQPRRATAFASGREAVVPCRTGDRDRVDARVLRLRSTLGALRGDAAGVSELIPSQTTFENATRYSDRLVKPLSASIGHAKGRQK